MIRESAAACCSSSEVAAESEAPGDVCESEASVREVRGDVIAVSYCMGFVMEQYCWAARGRKGELTSIVVAAASAIVTFTMAARARAGVLRMSVP
jgi:hypothetical protein